MMAFVRKRIRIYFEVRYFNAQKSLISVLATFKIF